MAQQALPALARCSCSSVRDISVAEGSAHGASLNTPPQRLPMPVSKPSSDDSLAILSAPSGLVSMSANMSSVGQ